MKILQEFQGIIRMALRCFVADEYLEASSLARLESAGFVTPFVVATVSTPETSWLRGWESQFHRACRLCGRRATATLSSLLWWLCSFSGGSPGGASRGATSAATFLPLVLWRLRGSEPAGTLWS